MTSTITAHEEVLLPVTTKPSDNIDGCPICYDDNWFFADDTRKPTTKSDDNAAQNLGLFAALPFHDNLECAFLNYTSTPTTETEEDGIGQSSLELFQALPYHLSAQETSSSSWCSLNPVSLACGHMFCLPCIIKWIGKIETCPMCRQDIDFQKPWLYPPPSREWELDPWLLEVDQSADQLSDRFGLDSRAAREVCRLNRMTYREILAASIRDEDTEIFVDIRMLKRRLFPTLTNIAGRTLMPLVHSFHDKFKGVDRILRARFHNEVTRALGDVLASLGKTLPVLLERQMTSGRRHHGLGIDWKSWESGASYQYCVRMSPSKLREALEESVEGLTSKSWKPIPTPLQTRLQAQDAESVDYMRRLRVVWRVFVFNSIDYLCKFACAWDQIQGILPSDIREQHALCMWLFERGERSS